MCTTGRSDVAAHEEVKRARDPHQLRKRYRIVNLYAPGLRRIASESLEIGAQAPPAVQVHLHIHSPPQALDAGPHRIFRAFQTFVPAGIEEP